MRRQIQRLYYIKLSKYFMFCNHLILIMICLFTVIVKNTLVCCHITIFHTWYVNNCTQNDIVTQYNRFEKKKRGSQWGYQKVKKSTWTVIRRFQITMKPT